MGEGKIVIKYVSSKKEVTEREISGISCQVAKNGHKLIYAYCHLREGVTSFILDNIVEIKIDGEITDKDQFWKEHIKDRKKLAKDLEKMLKKKKKEFDQYVELIQSLVDLVSADEG